MRKHAMKQEIENNALEKALGALKESIARWTDKSDRVETAIPGLILARRAEPSEPISILYEPRVCVIAQGAKRVELGNDAYVYDTRHFLLTSVDLPTFVQVIKASPERPYLGLVLNIDQREISQLMVDSHLPPPRPQQSSRGMAIGEVNVPLLTALGRL